MRRILAPLFGFVVLASLGLTACQTAAPAGDGSQTRSETEREPRRDCGTTRRVC